MLSRTVSRKSGPFGNAIFAAPRRRRHDPIQPHRDAGDAVSGSLGRDADGDASGAGRVDLPGGEPGEVGHAHAPAFMNLPRWSRDHADLCSVHLPTRAALDPRALGAPEMGARQHADLAGRGGGVPARGEAGVGAGA